MGMYNEKLWDRRGFAGSFMGPLEDFYFEFMPDPEMVERMNLQRNRVIT
jgi:hypothetical protein